MHGTTTHGAARQHALGVVGCKSCWAAVRDPGAECPGGTDAWDARKPEAGGGGLADSTKARGQKGKLPPGESKPQKQRRPPTRGALRAAGGCAQARRAVHAMPARGPNTRHPQVARPSSRGARKRVHARGEQRRAPGGGLQGRWQGPPVPDGCRRRTAWGLMSAGGHLALARPPQAFTCAVQDSGGPGAVRDGVTTVTRRNIPRAGARGDSSSKGKTGEGARRCRDSRRCVRN